MFVKICGITNEDDALLAIAMGADAVGFVFAPSSRQISPTKAGDIAKRLPKEAQTVGVFRNESKERVVRAVSEAGLGCAQLHGYETLEECQWVAERVPMMIKGFAAGETSTRNLRGYGTKYVLLDAPTPGAGQVFDWSLAENAPRDLRVIMAGGLTPQNVSDAVRKVQPWGVDVSTGVESAPGKKDPTLVKSFVDAARKSAKTIEEETSAAQGGEEDDIPYNWEVE